MTILQTVNLTKTYGKLTAVDHINLEIKQGDIFGILGPNGSGKTTTLGMILGVTQPSSGSYSWFENTIKKNHRRKIGTLLETPNFYPYLDAVENLKIVGRIKNIKSNDFDQVLEMVNLKDRKKDKFKTYSLGMKQRLAIGASLIGDPEVIILDEPTNGLDPQGIVEIRETIKSIARNGKTIILASHLLGEVQKICEDVAIIKKGKTIYTGPISEVINQSQKVIEVGVNQLSKFEALLDEISGINKKVNQNNRILLHTDETVTTETIGKIALQNQIIITHLLERTNNLEAAFLKLIKNP